MARKKFGKLKNNRGLSLGPQFPEGTENNLNYLDHLLEIADNLQFSVGSSQNLSSSSVHSEFSDFSQEDITALGLDSSSNIKDVIKTHLSTFINNIKNNIRIADAPENDDERKNQFYTPIRQNLYPVIVFLLEHRDDERIKSFIIEIAKASSWCSTRYNQLSRAAYVMFFPSLEQTEFSPFENILFKILRQEREEVFNRIFTKATIEGHLAYYQGGNHYHINNVHADRLLDQLCGRFGIKTFQNYDDPNHPIIDLNVLRTLTNQFYTTYNSEAVVLRVTDVLRSDFDFRESFFNYLDSHVPEDFDPASLELPEDIRLQPFDKFQEENCRGKTPQEVIDLYAEKKKTSYKFLFQNIASGEWNEEKIQELLVSIGVFQRNPLVQDGSEILFL